jgi:G:T/U-mismatch repair DNA glycosylase
MTNKPIPHPFKWYVPEYAETLVIGTFPPVKERWSYEFFYPNIQNLFWKILAKIAGHELSLSGSEMVHNRKEILHVLKVGITDMGGTIIRLKQDSKDESLEIVEYMNILGIIQSHPTIRKIILTSSSGRSSAFGWFKEYLAKNSIVCVVPSGKKPLHFQVVLSGRTIDVYILYSPSPRAANRISPEKLVEMYRSVIIDR